MEVAELFEVIGSGPRLKLMRVLNELKQPTIVRVVAQYSNMRPSVCSKHLMILYRSGIVSKIQTGKFACYSLNHDSINKMISFLKELSDGHEDQGK